MKPEERASWDEAHAILCRRGDATCSEHQEGNWWHLTYDALARIDRDASQIHELLEEADDLRTEIRRLQRGNHPAGRALQGPANHAAHVLALRAVPDDAAALAEALTERDAGHEGGGGA